MPELFLAIAILLQAPPAQDPKSEITEKEAVEFARKIEAGLLEGKPETFDRALDMEAMSEIAARGLDLTAPELEELRGGFAIGMELGRKLVPSAGGSYRFLGFRTVGVHRGPLFRFWSEEGLNYHVLILKKTPAGAVRISDIFVFLLGDRLSSLFRRSALAFVMDDSDRRDKLAPEEVGLVRNLLEMRGFARLVKEGRSQEALDLFKTLPESVRKDRTAQAMRIVAAIRIGGAEYTKAEEEFRRHFPGDISFDLVAFDGLVDRKEFDKALKGLDRFDRSVGGDPALNCLRGNALLAMEKLAESKAVARQAAKDVPYLQEPRWLLVTIALKEKAHADTVTLLTAIEKDFSVEVGDLTTLALYADFVKSREYRDWMKSRVPK